MSGQYSFPPYQDSTSFSLSPVPGYSSGNGALDMLMSMMIGQNAMPRPILNSNQTMYDAFRMRDRNLEYLKLRELAFRNSFVSQRFFGGVNTDSALFKVMSPFVTDPDGIVQRTLAPLQGGNPVQAQMRLFAGLTGQTASAFGESGYASVPQTSAAMEALFKQAYTFRTVRGDYDQAQGFTPGNTVSLREYRDNLMRSAKGRLSSSQFGLLSSIVGSSHEGFLGRIGAAERMLGNASNGDLVNLLESTQKDIGLVRQNDKLSSADRDQEIDRLKRKAVEAAETFLKSFKDPDAKNKMTEAFRNAIEGGDAGTKQFASQFSKEAGRVVEELKGYGSMVAKLGKEMPTGLNLAATRGFALEDISSAFIAAGDLRMVKGKRGYTQAMEDFVKPGNALSVLDAARGIYGNDASGRELVTNLSNLMDRSFYGLDDPNQARKLEDMLHGMKAAARTAGITVDSILGIIEQGKQLTEASGLTSGIGGAFHVQSAVSAVNQGSLMANFLSNQSVRRLGGTRGLVESANVGTMLAASEPITQRIAALSAMYADDRTVQDDITAFMSGKMGPLDRAHTNQFINEIARRKGINPYTLDQYLQNAPEASKLGLTQRPELARLASRAYADMFDNVLIANGSVGSAANASMLKQIAFGDYANVGEMQAAAERLASMPGLSAAMADKIRNLAAARTSNDNEALDLTTFKVRTGIFDKNDVVGEIERRGYQGDVYSRVSKRYRDLSTRQDLYHTQAVELNREFQKKMGMFQAKPLTMLVNEIMNGNVSQFGVQALLSPFMMSEDGKSYTSMYNSWSAAGDLNSYVGNAEEGLAKYIAGVDKTDVSNLLAAGAVLDPTGLRYVASASKEKQQGLFEQKINELLGSGDTDKADRLKKLGLSGVLRAARTLNAIDPYGTYSDRAITGASLIRHASLGKITQGVEETMADARRKQSDLLNTHYSLDPSDLQEMSGLSEFGVVVDGKVKYDKLSELLRRKDDVGVRFASAYEGVQKRLSTAGKDRLSTAIGEYGKQTQEIDEKVGQMTSVAKTAQQQENLIKAVQELTSTFGALIGGGKDGGSSLIQSLTKLTTAVMEVGKQ